jgi:hypothetical protein
VRCVYSRPEASPQADYILYNCWLQDVEEPPRPGPGWCTGSAQYCREHCRITTQAPGNPLPPLLLRWNDLGGYPCKRGDLCPHSGILLTCSGAACFQNMLTAVHDYLGGISAGMRRPVGVKELPPRDQLATSERAAISDKRSSWTSPALGPSCAQHGPRISEAPQLPRSAAGASRRCSTYSAVQKDHANFVPSKFGCACM